MTQTIKPDMVATLVRGEPSANFEKFAIQGKELPFKGTLYVQPDQVPEGCSDIIVTITFKED